MTTRNSSTRTSSKHLSIAQMTAQQVKDLIRPLIAPPTKQVPNVTYYINFQQAKYILDQKCILEEIHKQAQIAFNKRKRNSNPLLEHASDVESEVYASLQRQFQTKGLTCDFFEEDSFQVKAWLRCVFLNRGKDVLKKGSSRYHHLSMDDESTSWEHEFAYDLNENQGNDVETLSLNNWFQALPPIIANDPKLGLNPSRLLLWKMINTPNKVCFEDFKYLNSKANMRSQSAAYALWTQEWSTFDSRFIKRKSYGTILKDLAIYVLYDFGFSSLKDLRTNMNKDELAYTRENKIRKTLNRADEQIWENIMLVLLCMSPKDAYIEEYAKMLKKALHEMKNLCHKSRKSAIGFPKTIEAVHRWVGQNVQANKITAYPKVELLLNVLYAEDNNKMLSENLSTRNYEKLANNFRLARQVAENISDQFGAAFPLFIKIYTK